MHHKSFMQAKLSFGNSIVKRSPFTHKMSSKGNIHKAVNTQLVIWNQQTADKDRHDKLSAAMHHTRVWCIEICKCCGMTRPPAKDCACMMKVEAAAYNGSDAQDRS